MPPQRPIFQTLCDEIMNMGDLLACYVINQKGELLGANYGQVPVDDALKHDFSQVAAIVWGGLQRVTNLGGSIKMVSAIFENFKILGIPVEGTNVALLLTVDVKLDSVVLRDRIGDFMKYWLKANHYVG
jgi:hypothetical protein